MDQNTFDIRAFGAVGDGSTDDTHAIRAALDRCQAAGGGVVRFRPGTYLTGPVECHSNLTIELEDGATLLFSSEFERYEPVWTRWEGVECWAMHPLLYGVGLSRVAISGGGVIDGNGGPWWEALISRRAQGRLYPETSLEKKFAKLNKDITAASGGGGREMQFLRPPLIQFINCTDVRIEGVTVRNSPFWTIHPVYCRNLAILGVRVENPDGAPNTDGLDLDSCSDVRVENCVFDVGDDCLCLKSGSGPDGLRVNRPTENVFVTGCEMRRGHGGVVVGSETAGGIRRVRVKNCVFRDTDRGIRFKTRRGRAGELSEMTFSNIEMENVLCPIVVNMYYRCGSRDDESELFDTGTRPVTSETPAIKSLIFSKIFVKNIRGAAGFFVGLPEQPLERILIEDCRFDVKPDAGTAPDEAAMARGLPLAGGRGVRLRNIKDSFFRQVTVELPGGKPFLLEDGADVMFDD